MTRLLADTHAASHLHVPARSCNFFDKLAERRIGEPLIINFPFATGLKKLQVLAELRGQVE